MRCLPGRDGGRVELTRYGSKALASAAFELSWHRFPTPPRLVDVLGRGRDEVKEEGVSVALGRRVAAQTAESRPLVGCRVAARSDDDGRTNWRGKGGKRQANFSISS